MAAMVGTDLHPELGSPVADHLPNYAYTARRVLGGGLCAVAGVVVALAGLKVIPLPIREGFWETAAALVMGGILLVFGLYFAVDAVRCTGPRVVVYERGFVAGREVFLWDRVEAFYQLVAELSVSGLPLSLTEYSVRRDDGRVIRFTRGVCGAGTLATEIQERINPRLLADARAAFAAGREVRFGEVLVDAGGLKFSDVGSGRARKVSWNEIDRLDPGGMQIHVRKAGESRLARLAGGGESIATRQVANMAVFLALVGEILARRPKGQQGA
jgi:hypothetical protein